MHVPGLPSLLFLVFLLVALPLGARRTAQRLRAETGAAPVSRTLYWQSAVQLQLVMLVLAWLTGNGFGYQIFAIDELDYVDGLQAAAAFGACYGLRLLSRWARSDEELKDLSVFKRAPRTRSELIWFNAAVVVASIAEEAAYRGVGWSIVWYSLGDPWLAAVIMALAFALAHWNQGWKSGVTIFSIALVMHGLVAVTGTLVPAMLVHALYDFVVGYQIRAAARNFDQAEQSQ